MTASPFSNNRVAKLRAALPKRSLGLVFSLVLATALAVPVKAASKKDSDTESKSSPAPSATPNFKNESANSTGTVTVQGSPIQYDAVAGTIVVHPKGWDDAAAAAYKDAKEKHENEESEESEDNGEKKNPTAEASMFYVAYTKQHVEPDKRPVTFLFNGGPGSSTVWLHMGAFGPRRVITADDTHTPAAPYQIVSRDYSLLETLVIWYLS